jgi:hypothetical protein
VAAEAEKDLAIPLKSTQRGIPMEPNIGRRSSIPAKERSSRRESR